MQASKPFLHGKFQEKELQCVLQEEEKLKEGDCEDNM